MMIELFYMFINTDLGEKVKNVLNDLFPGLIKEPKRVPVRVPVPQPRRKDTDKIKQKAAENYPLLLM